MKQLDLVLHSKGWSLILSHSILEKTTLEKGSAHTNIERKNCEYSPDKRKKEKTFFFVRTVIIIIWFRNQHTVSGCFICKKPPSSFSPSSPFLPFYRNSLKKKKLRKLSSPTANPYKSWLEFWNFLPRTSFNWL